MIEEEEFSVFWNTERGFIRVLPHEGRYTVAWNYESFSYSAKSVPEAIGIFLDKANISAKEAFTLGLRVAKQIERHEVKTMLRKRLDGKSLSERTTDK